VRHFRSWRWAGLTFILLLLTTLQLVRFRGLLTAPVSVPATVVPGGTFYVDALAGNDANTGTSMTSPWKNVTRANQAKLRPGDELLFKRGSVWSQQLRASWTGTASRPIFVGAYGTGDPPLLQNNQDGNIRVTGSYQIIENLQTTNSPKSYGRTLTVDNNQPLGWVVGVNFVNGSHNTLHNVLVTHAAAAVSLSVNTSDNHILNNEFRDNDGAWKAPTDPGGLRGGTGIILSGTGNEIAYNHFEGNATRYSTESIAIELFNASRSNIHHNTVVGDKDFVETGSSATFQSADNTIAYNIHTSSKADACFVNTRGLGDSFGPVWRTSVFNNVAYLTGVKSEGVVCASCSPDILRLQNNIIVVAWKAFYVGPGERAIETNNLFWSPTGQVPQSNFLQNWTLNPTSYIADPQFVDPAHLDFHLRPTSPAIDAGVLSAVKAGYTTDLAGNAVPPGTSPNLGVYETSGSVDQGK
jgi:hypothetical protein